MTAARSPSPELTPEDRELLRGDAYAWFVTLDADGTPAASILWVDADETRVLVNTAEGRRKERNASRNPRVTVAVERDPYHWLSIEGVVDERVTGPEAEAHIDTLSRRYDGEPWTPVQGQVRVLFKIRPVRIVRYAE
jgi:PPOX class probable F420-dependent enzyme